MSLYLVRAEKTTANAWATDQPGRDRVKADGLHSQRGSLRDWLQTSVLEHWLDLAVPKCGCDEPEGRKRVNRQWCCTFGMQSFQQQHLFMAVLLLPFTSPTAPHGFLRCVGMVVLQPVPWTVLRNWSRVQKLIRFFFFFFFFSLSGSRGQLLAWSWLCCYPGCNTKPQLTVVRGSEETNGTTFFAHWLMHSM